MTCSAATCRLGATLEQHAAVGSQGVCRSCGDVIAVTVGGHWAHQQPDGAWGLIGWSDDPADVAHRAIPERGLTDALLLDSDSDTDRARDNRDPHPVAVRVLPRDVYPGQAGCSPRQWEAELELSIEHPQSCSGAPEECPVADYLECVGIDEDLYRGFPEPDRLTDAELAALDGTVRFVTITRTYTAWSSPNGVEHDVEYFFEWSEE